MWRAGSVPGAWSSDSERGTRDRGADSGRGNKDNRTNRGLIACWLVCLGALVFAVRVRSSSESRNAIGFWFSVWLFVARAQRKKASVVVAAIGGRVQLAQYPFSFEGTRV